MSVIVRRTQRLLIDVYIITEVYDFSHLVLPFQGSFTRLIFTILHCVFVVSTLAFAPGTCGLYYKHLTIVNDNSSIISKWSFKLLDDSRVVIYNLHMFIVQITHQTQVHLQSHTNASETINARLNRTCKWTFQHFFVKCKKFNGKRQLWWYVLWTLLSQFDFFLVNKVIWFLFLISVHDKLFPSGAMNWRSSGTGFLKFLRA